MDEALKQKVELASTRKYLDIQDVSLLANKSISTIRRKMELGILKPYQDGARGKLLFLRSQVESWIERGRK